MRNSWADVDRFITDNLLGPDPILDNVLKNSLKNGLPSIHVAPNQGKFLHILALSCQAKNILEIGTLGAYSSIWLARALPTNGSLITLEANPHHAQIAAENVKSAGLSHLIHIKIGRALDILPTLAGQGHPSFDFIFIDADKPNNAQYFQWALRLSHPGSIIVIDNVIRDGQIIDPNSQDPSVQGTRDLYQILGREKKVTATAVQTVGSKGYDGFVIMHVKRQN
ncbi:MAG: O-methyltransferase [Rhodospirillaceae bacterium]|nr:O-methyltransferase [Rhodospirillaceae bacterium]